MKKIGFIGTGKMASAIIKGLIKSNFITSDFLLASQTNPNNIQEKSNNLGIKIVLDNQLVADTSDIIFIATKPTQVIDVLAEIAPKLSNNKLIISIAAGVTLKTLESNLPTNTKVIRVMPNTPALVGAGMSAITKGKYATNEDITYVENLLSSIGKCVVIDSEQLMDVVTAISGSGPAFYYKVINEIAKAGEKLGLDYEQALLLSIQTAIGSAQMALERNLPMETLISNVATKGGCTRAGVDCMDEYKTETIWQDVINKTTQRAKELGQ